MHTVFILGAGASVCAGAPTMATFLDRANALSRQHGDWAGKDQFAQVFEAIAELRTTYQKSYLDVDNIEVLFGAIEMARLVGKYGDRSPEQIEKLREALITTIVATIERTTAFPVKEGTLTPPKAHQKLCQWMVEAQNQDSRNTFAVLTFNYDLVLEVAMARAGISYNYWLDPNDVRGLPMLKLHGSINWGRCPKCSAIIPLNVYEFQRAMLGAERVTLDLGTGMAQHLRHCPENVTVEGPPILVPPSFDKAAAQSVLRPVWTRAALELGRAAHLVVVGYSLPETDSFFRYLFALGTDSRTRIETITIMDPDPTGKVQERFDQIIGRGVRQRVKFLNGPAGMMEDIHSVIGKLISTKSFA